VDRVDHHGTELLSADDAATWGARATATLKSAGVPARSFVVFQARNSAALLAAIYGCLRSQLAPVVIGASLSESEANSLLEGLPYATLLRDDDVVALCASSPRSHSALTEHFGCRPVHFTSGTTGRPKGVWSGWLSEADARALADEERDTWSLTSDDVHLVSGPLSHSAPLRFALQTLLHGGSVLVPESFDARRASSLVESVATTAFMAPVHLQRLLDTAPPRRTSLRLLAHAGSSCPEHLRRRAMACFGLDVLVEFYGSTEGQFTRCAASEWLEHPGSVGRARPGRRLRADGDGRLWCRTPAYARFEYWNDPEKTAEAWDRDWFTVGDLGRIDDDGYVHLEGRRADLIITGGVNVYPAEVELALSHVAGVHEVAVFGTEDPTWGQRVCVAYVGTASEDDLRDYGATHLAAYKRPKTVVKVDGLPHTHSGKIDRMALPSLIEPSSPPR
jgi:long-chain acyl-CoA synthetase